MNAQAQELASTAEQLKSLVGRFELQGSASESANDTVVPLRRAA